MITLHWLYALAGRDVRGLRAAVSALDRTNPKRFGNAAFWGLMALSLLGGDRIGDFGNGLLVLGLAGLAGFGFIGRSHPPTTSDEEREAWSRQARQQAVPAGADHPGDRAASARCVYNYTPLGAARLDRGQARDLRLPRPRRAARARRRSSPGCGRRRSRRCRKGGG